MYQICGIVGIVPPIAEDEIKQLCGLLVNVLIAVGVVVDPTTAGIGDSSTAMEYVIPNPDNDPEDNEVLPQ